MLQELLDFIKQNGLTMWNLWNFVGASMGIFLGILKILEFKKNRVSIDIELKQKRFSSRRIDYGEYVDETIIEIDVDLKNKGLEPTTLVGVDFYSNNESLNNLEMTNDSKCVEPFIRIFEEIRIVGNGRPRFKLHTSKNVLLPNEIRELNATLVFKTTHKDIPKKIKLIRKDE